MTQTDSFGKNWGTKNLGKLLQNVTEKSFINWRVLPLIKINTRILDTPCIINLTKKITTHFMLSSGV
jgi:hypothetical protein